MDSSTCKEMFLSGGFDLLTSACMQRKHLGGTRVDWGMSQQADPASICLPRLEKLERGSCHSTAFECLSAGILTVHSPTLLILSYYLSLSGKTRATTSIDTIFGINV